MEFGNLTSKFHDNFDSFCKIPLYNAGFKEKNDNVCFFYISNDNQRRGLI